MNDPYREPETIDAEATAVAPEPPEFVDPAPDVTRVLGRLQAIYTPGCEVPEGLKVALGHRGVQVPEWLKVE